jgi:hypothetical protein
MSATATTPGAVTSNSNREVISRACERHNRVFNQQRTRESSGKQWGPWIPAECPQCEEETRQELQRQEAERKWNEETFPALKAEIIAESDARRAADPEREERIAALTDFLLDDAWRKYCALNLADFRKRADSEDAARIDEEIIVERKKKFLEAELAKAAETSSTLEANLAAEREQKIKESLSGWALLG